MQQFSHVFKYTQLFVHLRLYDLEDATQRLDTCIDEIILWSLSMHLELNPEKSDLIWFNCSFKVLQSAERSVSTSSLLLSLSLTVWDLAVILDSTLSLKPQIAAITRACLFHLVKDSTAWLYSRCSVTENTDTSPNSDDT